LIDKLTEKQKKFCEEYIIDFNATQSAIRAGYSENTAKIISSQNLTKLNIQTYIQELIKGREKRTEITADMVVKELAKIAFFDIKKIFRKDGGLLNPCDLDDDTSCVVSGIKARDVKNGDDIETIVEYKLNDKIKSLELLGKHLGIFDRTIKIEDETKTNAPTQITIIRDV
jgi:phage terminase small subunit